MANYALGINYNGEGGEDRVDGKWDGVALDIQDLIQINS